MARRCASIVVAAAEACTEESRVLMSNVRKCSELTRNARVIDQNINAAYALHRLYQIVNAIRLRHVDVARAGLILVAQMRCFELCGICVADWRELCPPSIPSHS